ncbi:uncharacterized protein LOC127575665 [Pristis pectinata]|uniref:uncharacterized protein LOC127575665 n=1 Tax=Pristis pectinata TaxID=685728 RepID=UPI00223DD76F|nr:uncharacterized protein LOC127575665 [Pristis pectinata]
MDNRQYDFRNFTEKDMFEHSLLRDDSGESGPNHGMEPLQYVHQKITYKPLVEGFQDILSERRKAATEGHHKKIKNNHKVTFLKCPHHKIHKRVKHYEINEPTFTESWKDRRISYSDLPTAPPLPEESFWNYSDALEQSVPKHNFSPSSENSGLMASKTDKMKEDTEQLGSLYPNSYTSQRSKKGVSVEPSSPILIHIISPHQSHLPLSQAVDIHNISNSSIGLTFDQTDDYTPGSGSSPDWPSDIEANAVPISPAQTMHPRADDSMSGAAISPTQSPSTQVGSNEQDEYNYYRQSGVTFAENVPDHL